MDHDQIRFDCGACGVGGQIIQVGFKQFRKSNRLVHTLEGVVKLLGDVKKCLVALDGKPASVNAERAGQRNHASQHLRHPTAHKGRIDIRPAFPLNGGDKLLERIDPFLANIGLVFVNRQERFRCVFFQHGRPVTHDVCPYDRPVLCDEHLRFSRNNPSALFRVNVALIPCGMGAGQRIWRYKKSQSRRVVNGGAGAV